MPASPDLPWSRINDFLVEVGSARNKNEFGHRALVCLNDLLVPFDINGVYGVVDSTGFHTRATILEASKWIELHNNYYWKAMPNPNPGSKQLIMDWRHWRDTEYATDFMNPQGIGFSARILNLGLRNDVVGIFGIHRSKRSPGFTEKERAILEVIQPHLSNFYAMHSLLAQYDAQLPDAAVIASDYKILTKREAEIVALLCRRFSTGMIASQLLISPATVYRHIANIFAKLNVFNRAELMEKLLSSSIEGNEREAH